MVKGRRRHWLNWEEAARAAHSDALQQGAHIAFKDGLFKVHRGSLGSAVGDLLIYKCVLNEMSYCGFYDRRSLIAEIADDFKFIAKSYETAKSDRKNLSLIDKSQSPQIIR